MPGGDSAGRGAPGCRWSKSWSPRPSVRDTVETQNAVVRSFQSCDFVLEIEVQHQNYIQETLLQSLKQIYSLKTVLGNNKQNQLTFKKQINQRNLQVAEHFYQL